MKQAWNEAMDCNGFENKETDTEYNIIETDSSIMISFKGSTSDMDWWQNFMIWKKPYKHMKKLFFVHAGFLKKYKSVRDDIMLKIIDARKAGKHIKIRGYSQGAVLALLCHEDVWFSCSSYLSETKVFGCLRVFSIFNNKELKKRLSNVIRIQNGNDIATKFPFFWMLYKHYGKKVNIGSKRRWWKFSFKDHNTYEENL